MKFIKVITRCGAPLFVLPMSDAHTVAAGVLVHVGSRDEKFPEEAGLAHSFEHMFFQGTKQFPNKQILSEYIEEVGGYKNGFTWKELTFFFNQVPHTFFKRSVHLLSEQLQYSLIPEKQISTEMKVVIQELHRVLDAPQKLIQEMTWEHIFRDHPLGHMGLGVEDSLLHFNREHFLSFIERYYHPGNYTFLVAGKLDARHAQELFDTYFLSPTQKEKNIRTSHPVTPPKEDTIVIQKPFNQTHITVAAPVIAANAYEKICLNLFSLMVWSGSSSPLEDEIRNKRGLSYSVFTRYYPGTDAGLFFTYMATSSENYKNAIEIVFSTLEKMKRDSDRLEKIKKMKLGMLALRFENPLNIITDAAWDIIFFDKPQGYEETIAAIQDVTVKDVEDAVNKYLARDNFKTILFMKTK